MPCALSSVPELSPDPDAEFEVPSLLALLLVLAIGAETPFVALAVDAVDAAVLLDPALAEDDGLLAAATKGFEELPPVPEVRSREKVVSWSC